MQHNAFETWKRTLINEPPFLSVVIPAFNESERIVPTIGAIAAHVCAMQVPWELIIADDGSHDETVHLVKDLELANLQVLQADRNGGKGSAVRRGMLAARGRYVLFADADNSTPIQALESLLSKVQHEGYDMAIGSRAIDGADEAHRSLLRRLLSGGLRLIVRYGLRVGMRDTQCGFKLYTREAAHRLHGAQTINGFSFDLEILFLADRLNFRVAEVPVAWVDAPGSKVDPIREVKHFLRDLLMIKLNDLRGLYTGA